MRKYENLDRIYENREAPRSHYIPYDSLEKALEGDPFKSSFYQLLNGEWNFKYYSRDVDFEENITFTDKVAVPSCWQYTGYEKPYYTNVEYPYMIDAPYVPTDNPLGVYNRTFEIPEMWAERETYIVFEGVCSYLELFINGEYVGATSGSHLMSEFDLTKYVHAGTNEITAKVYKWCAGSYLEDQDFFRNNGIFRDVYLLSRCKNHVKDIEIKTDLKGIYYDGDFEIYAEGKKLEKIEIPVLWNAENPYLYTVIVKSGDEFIPQKVGLREIKLSDKGEFLINGVSVKLFGVNHHDTHPETGCVMTREFIKDELLLMKKLNMNTVRTSHYPPSPDFMELCDEIGMYVVLETDVETHGYGRRGCKGVGYDDSPLWPCKDPKWEKAFVERQERALERDKNHPCVIMWSLGNESNYGVNHTAMCRYIESRNTGIPIHYEGATSGADEETKDFIIIRSKMYWWYEEMEKIGEDQPHRPFFLCEYCHAMGNGPGDLFDYMEWFDKNSNAIGGCIWEWADHTWINEKGVPCYGGDGGEEVHMDNFCCDGLVFHDRSLKAGSLEAKAAYQPMKTKWESGKLFVRNRYDFTDFSGFDFRYEVECDGEKIGEGSFKLNTPPHGTEEVELSLNLPESCRLGAYLNVYMYGRDGYEISREQHKLEVPVVAEKTERTPAKITVEGMLAKTGFATFDLHYGELVWIKGATGQPVKLGIWRAPLDNDRVVRGEWKYNNYHHAYNNVRKAEIDGNKIIVEAAFGGVASVPSFCYTVEYSFFENGEIDVDFKTGKFDQSTSFLPRLGYEFKLPRDKNRFTYFARGKAENYRDMHHYAFVGKYESTADEEYVNYIMPQEHGNHIGAKYVDFGSFAVKTEGEFEFAVSNYSAQALTKAMHQDELKKDGFVHFRVDYGVSGVGSGSCGPQLMRKYRLCNDEMNYKFTIVTR